MTCAIERTLDHTLFLARHLGHCDYLTVVSLVLYELGVSPKNDGFTYLKKAISMRYENPTRQLKSDIYVALSIEIDGVSDSERIEQAIRRAIADAWENRDEEIWDIIFPKTKRGHSGKPSNGDFIARVAWFVELWHGCCKEVTYAKR